MTATAAPALALRVRVQDAWEELAVEVPADMTVAGLKAQSLGQLRITRDPDAYVMKFRGAELIDEARTLAEAGIVPNAALIVLPRRRRPVR